MTYMEVMAHGSSEDDDEEEEQIRLQRFDEEQIDEEQFDQEQLDRELYEMQLDNEYQLDDASSASDESSGSYGRGYSFSYSTPGGSTSERSSASAGGPGGGASTSRYTYRPPTSEDTGSTRPADEFQFNWRPGRTTYPPWEQFIPPEARAWFRSQPWFRFPMQPWGWGFGGWGVPNFYPYGWRGP